MPQGFCSFHGLVSYYTAFAWLISGFIEVLKLGCGLLISGVLICMCRCVSSGPTCQAAFPHFIYTDHGILATMHSGPTPNGHHQFSILDLDHCTLWMIHLCLLHWFLILNSTPCFPRKWCCQHMHKRYIYTKFRAWLFLCCLSWFCVLVKLKKNLCFSWFLNYKQE